MKPRKKTAVLVSGNGSNLQALIDAAQDRDYPAEISLVLSNRREAYALKRAASEGIPSQVILHGDYATREAFDKAMHEALTDAGIELVCLAGFMRLLSPWFVQKWHDRMLNIHPSLLPAFKGLDAVTQALDAGVKITGCSVHIVRAQMDVGPLIIQAAVPVLSTDTPESLAERIHAEEHRIYPQALAWLAGEQLDITEERAYCTCAKSIEEPLIVPPLAL